jgi:hypothetical protein
MASAIKRIGLANNTREYLNGTYNVLDITAMQAGFRKEVWHGFWMTKQRPQAKLAEYKERQPEIQKAVRKQLAGFLIFTAAIGTRPRILERLEAAIMEALYKQPMPLCDIPDRGMMARPALEIGTADCCQKQVPAPAFWPSNTALNLDKLEYERIHPCRHWLQSRGLECLPI